MDQLKEDKFLYICLSIFLRLFTQNKDFIHCLLIFFLFEHKAVYHRQYVVVVCTGVDSMVVANMEVLTHDR